MAPRTLEDRTKDVLGHLHFQLLLLQRELDIRDDRIAERDQRIAELEQALATSSAIP